MNRMHSYTEEEIALYVNGDMAGEEQQQFEQVLQRDKTLQDNVRQYQQVQAALRTRLAPDAQDKALSQTLHSLNEEYFGKTEAKIRPVGIYIKWASAAAVVAMLLVVNLFHPWKQHDLYKEYGGLQMVTSAERGDHTDTLLQRATTAFNSQQFAVAAKDLQVVFEKNPEDAMVTFYYGVSLIETGDLRKAEEMLEHVYAGNSVFKYDAAYFMAIRFLKEHKYTDCRKWLQNIPVGTSRYAQAQLLLESIASLSE
jgi:tetratricopeptide (TPR) repeat protein